MKKLGIVASLLLLVAAVGIGGYFLLRKSPPAPQPATPQPAAQPAVAAHDYQKYDYSRGTGVKAINVGTQPGSLATAFATEALFRDRILQRQLAATGWTLRQHDFLTGDEMLPYANGRLDVLVLGDIPSMLATAQQNVGIFALARINLNSFIAKRRLTPGELKGLRIGFPPKTSAIFTVSEILKSANLSMADINQVPMKPTDLEGALRDGKVDAVAVWNPYAQNILDSIPGTVSFSSTNTFTCFVIDLDFAAQAPEQVKAFLAAVVRSTRWLKQSENNLRTGLEWIRLANIRINGKSAVVPDGKWIRLLRNETIENDSFPMLPLDMAVDGQLTNQRFNVLKEFALIPASVDWPTVRERLNSTLLPNIVQEGEKWQIDTFDYAPDTLPNK